MPIPESQFRDEARRLLRQWVAADESDVLASIDAIGARAIRSASEAGARLDRIPAGQSAEATLGNLERLAAELAAPARSDRGGFFGRAKPPQVDVHQRIRILVEDLDRERDAIAHSAIMLETDRKKLDEAATALDAAQLLIRACAGAVAAAERELAFDRPDRARFLRDSVQPRLMEREQDVLSQSAVTGHAVLTLRMLSDNQDVLGRAVTRARDISIAALRTAIAARRAVADGPDMVRQAARIEQASGATDGELRRALSDAVGEARREIDSIRSRNP